jgi:hypothetical protein
VSRGLVIIAGASGLSGELASFSNRAGVGRDNYLMALGERVRSFNQNGTPLLYSGTSFSAPLISGAVALLAEAFPNLTGQQIVQILYETAVDLGPAGIDADHGRGRLDLTRAFQPRGNTAIAGSAVPVDTADNGSLSSAMGSGTVQGTSAGAVILDGYGRAYRLDLGGTLRRAAPAQRLLPALAGGGRMLSGRVPGAMFAVTIASQGNGATIERLTLGRNDAVRARATAGMVAAQLGADLTAGFGVSQAGTSVARIVAGQGGSPFLVADDPVTSPGSNAAGLRDGAAPVDGAAGHDRDGGAWASTDHTAAARPARARALGRVGLCRRRDRAGSEFRAYDDRPRLSQLREEATMLGGRFGAAFGGGGATSDFLDLSAGPRSGRWTLDAAWRSGWTRGQGGGLSGRRRAAAQQRLGADDGARRGVRGAGRAAGGAAAAGRGRRLRPRRAGAYDYLSGATQMGRQRIDLTPTGARSTSRRAWAAAARRMDVDQPLLSPRPGHVATLPADIGGAVRWGIAF